jgi:hypothetical protein
MMDDPKFGAASQEEHDALLNIFLAHLNRTVVELHENVQFDVLTTWTGMLQAAAQMLTQIHRPWTAELLRAYADCIENEPSTRKYAHAQRRFIAVAKKLHARLQTQQAATGAGGIQ